MKVTGKNPDTGEEFEVESDDINEEFISSMSIFEMADNKIKKIIDNLDISADSKSLIYSFSKATIRIGEKLIRIGRKIVDYICRIFTEFPSASFGMIFGAIAGYLVSSIPFLGVALGPLFAPIAILFGLIGGLKEDFKDKAIIRKVSEANANFSPLNT